MYMVIIALEGLDDGDGDGDGDGAGDDDGDGDGVLHHQGDHVPGDHVRSDNCTGRPGAPDVQGQSKLEARTHKHVYTNMYEYTYTNMCTQTQACVVFTNSLIP